MVRQQRKSKGKWSAEHFAEQVRLARERNGWTQSELADRMSTKTDQVHWTTVAKMERGERSVRISEAAVLADLFDTTVDALLGRKARRGDETDYLVTTAVDTARRSGMELAAIQTALSDAFADIEDIEGLEALHTAAARVDDALQLAGDGLARIAYFRRLIPYPGGSKSQNRRSEPRLRR